MNAASGHYKLRGARVAFPLALAVVLSGWTTLSSAETILIDDFNDGNDDGWTRVDSNMFGQPWGPGIFDVSSGAYHLGTTGRVPIGTPAGGFVLSLWDQSVDPFYSNGLVRAKVRADTANSLASIVFRMSGDLETGLNGYLFIATSANGAFLYNRIVDTETAVFRVMETDLKFGLGEDWWIEAGGVGPHLSMKVWRDGDPEPEAPQMRFVDSTFGSGLLGVESNIEISDPNLARVDAAFDDVSFRIPEPPASVVACIGLTSLDIPDTVTIIDNGAVSGCTGLTSVTMPNSVANIGDWAFANCTGLTSVTIPDSVTSIGWEAFSGCTGLTSVIIPKSVTSIGEGAFSGCAGLAEITVDALNSVYSSLDGVLFNKNHTTLIQYPGGKAGSYTIPDSVTSIGGRAFRDCTGLTSVTIPDSVNSIGWWAFSGCTRLTSVYFRGRAPALGVRAFSGATNTTVYYLPATTGWDTTFGDRPTALWIPITLTLSSLGSRNALELVTRSPAPATVRVQRSVNLMDWEDWKSVSRDDGPSELQDADAGTTPHRFYRGIEE